MKILSIILALALSSCAVLRNENTAKYAGVIAQFATSYVLDKAVSDEDRAAKAEVIGKIAVALDKFNFSQKPSGSEVKDYILSKSPSGSHWVTLADKVSSFYSDKTANIKDEDVGAVKNVLDAVSAELLAATSTDNVK